jgi:transposase-like protein
VEEALESETGDAVGRDYYEHAAQPRQGYRNGYRTGRLKTAEGLMEYSAPQVAGRDQPFRSTIREHLKGHTQGLEDLAVEMLARGLSVRDIEDAFKDKSGRLLLSKTAVSQLGERLWEDYQAFARRDLSEYEISYLFVDGIAERLRPGAPNANPYWRTLRRLAPEAPLCGLFATAFTAKARYPCAHSIR